MRLLVVACLLSVAFAGCVAPATALDLQSSAQDEAETFDEDAYLVGMLSAEWTNDSLLSEFESQSPEADALNQGVDLNPGDGLANAWGYFFHTSDGPLMVAVGADGRILDTQLLNPDDDEDNSFGFTTALGEFSIDSDEAASIVRENHERFSDIILEEDVLVMMALVREDEYLNSVFWTFTGFTAEGEDFALAIVDAETGEYSDFSGFFG